MKVLPKTILLPYGTTISNPHCHPYVDKKNRPRSRHRVWNCGLWKVNRFTVDTTRTLNGLDEHPTAVFPIAFMYGQNDVFVFPPRLVTADFCEIATSVRERQRPPTCPVPTQAKQIIPMVSGSWKATAFPQGAAPITLWTQALLKIGLCLRQLRCLEAWNLVILDVLWLIIDRRDHVYSVKSGKTVAYSLFLYLSIYCICGA